MLSTPPPPHRGPVHTDALQVITEVTATLQHSLLRLENLQKLMELQRDLVGVENLVSPGRVSDPAGGGGFQLVTSLSLTDRQSKCHPVVFSMFTRLCNQHTKPRRFSAL